jgi:hypothetical protein
MNDELSILLSGNYQDLGELSDILTQLATTVDDFVPRCYSFIQNDSPDITTFGAYCGRTLLETACTILIGRIHLIGYYCSNVAKNTLITRLECGIMLRFSGRET